LCCFFFSSRRRHTRFSRDWSSDVCSSDLGRVQSVGMRPLLLYLCLALAFVTPLSAQTPLADLPPISLDNAAQLQPLARIGRGVRSEERRVGKDCRCQTAMQKCGVRMQRDK